jgi:hypothetical protein
MSKLLSTTKRVAIGVAAVALFSAPVLAHHGWAGYGADNFSIGGTVETVQLGSPHGIIMIKDTGGKIWQVTLGPAANQYRAGLTEQHLPKGTSVTAQGKRHRNAQTLEVKTERLMVGQRAFDIYPERLASWR